MRKTYIILLLFLTATLSAQSGIIKSYYSKGKIRAEISKVNDILDGTCFWFYENGNLKEEKTYDEGLLDGWVKEYYENGLLKREFYVKKGVKSGSYRSYFDNGALEKAVIYDDGEAGEITTFNYDSLYVASVDEFVGTRKLFEQRRKKELYLCSIDVCPEPIGGMDAIYAKLDYPEHARIYGLEGMLMVIATVDKEGFVTETEVVQPLGLGLDEAAQRAVRETRFLPGKNDDIKVKAKVTLKIVYSLNNLERYNLNGMTDLTNTDGSNNGENDAESSGEVALDEKVLRNFDCKIEICPKPKGGIQAILDRLYITPQAKRNEIEGDIIVLATVDIYGNVRETKVLKGLGYGLDDSAEIAILETSFEPGVNMGKEVKSEVKILLPIVLEK